MNLDWKKNLGNTDRLIRVAIGLLLMGLAYTKIITGWWATVGIIFALFQFIEAAFAY
ncbi:MAG: hypothetical protein A4E53_04585 [Pelotomaculum sp. PtaB.Bin104]|nr:MAG: hypothetical protein A4E53_04585 [Pelotomaculum sp. PtaB.Bin104]